MSIYRMQFAAAAAMLAASAMSLIPTAGAATVQAVHSPHAPVTAQQVFSKYETLSSYQATIKSNMVLQPVNGGTPNTVESSMSVSFQKPNLLHIDEQGLMGGGEVISNGQSIYTYSALTNQYSEASAPRDILKTLVLQKDAASNLKLVGHTSIDGKSVSEYHGTVNSSHGPSQVDMYIDDSTKLFRRVVAHMSRLPGPQGGNFRMTMTQDFLDQKIDSPIPAAVFKFTPPAGAQKGPAGAMSGIPGMPGS